ncbi:MAG TPA: PIN domain-containing protein [Candidatus Methylomirabilis sp.]|nr:PIN domain-containing protein [Candidatus Methylomirabilis sp.]
MGVILDTSIWVDVERGRLAPADVAALTGEEPVYLAPPVIAELQYGVDRAPNPGSRNRRASALARIRRKPCLIIDRETGEFFGRLAADLDSRGKPSVHRVNDLWLAALAIQHGMKVATQNARDFADVPGLDLVELPPRRPAK